jgi:hypothetical protein
MAGRQAGCPRLASGIVHATGMLLHGHGTPSYSYHRPTPIDHHLAPWQVHTRAHTVSDRVKESRGAGKRSEREAVAMSYSGACSTTHTSLVELLLMLGAAGAAPTSIAASHVRRAQSLEIEYICRSSNK